MPNGYQNRRNDRIDIMQDLQNKDKYLSIYSGNEDNIDLILEEIQMKLVDKYFKNISSSQLRNIYHKMINTKTANDLKLLRPQLMYISARLESGRGSEEGKASLEFIDWMIKQKVNNEEELKAFHKFLETIVSYHKYYNK